MEEEPFSHSVRCQNSNSCALITVPGNCFCELKTSPCRTFLKIQGNFKRGLCFPIFFNIKMNLQGSQVSLRWGRGMTPSTSQFPAEPPVKTLEATLTQLAKRPYPKQFRISYLKVPLWKQLHSHLNQRMGILCTRQRILPSQSLLL